MRLAEAVADVVPGVVGVEGEFLHPGRVKCVGVVEVGRDTVEVVAVVDVAVKAAEEGLPEEVLCEVVPVGVGAAVPECAVDDDA